MTRQCKERSTDSTSGIEKKDGGITWMRYGVSSVIKMSETKRPLPRDQGLSKL